MTTNESKKSQKNGVKSVETNGGSPYVKKQGLPNNNSNNINNNNNDIKKEGKKKT